MSIEVCDELVLQRTAHIVGPSSAAAAAIRERKRREEAGEKDVAVMLDNKRHVYLVGPTPSPHMGDE